jgi:hypothetical protein
MCLSAVKKDGRALKHVPKVLRTKAMCLEALNETAGALKYVPKILGILLAPKFTIHLTRDEIGIINAYVGHRGPIKIHEIMHGKLIHKSIKLKSKVIWTKSTTFTESISDIIFNEGHTKATLHILSHHIYDALGYAVEFSKENGKWRLL